MRADSDLDVFIVSEIEARKGVRQPGEGAKARLSRLDGIVVKAALIKANDALGFQPFSKDGKYLESYTIEQLCENLGRPEDDHANTFTARLLLLLESRPLLGEDVYRSAVGEVVASYWGDYEDRKDSFRPVFLINDILRLWKTLCVNYEAFTERQPAEKRAKRKLQNYKLKNSRVLTCYSSVLYLMQVFAEQATVHPADAIAMVDRSPSQRLEWIATRPGFTHAPLVSKLLSAYEQFLQSTAVGEERLLELFQDRDASRALVTTADAVGRTVAELVERMGADNGLFRYLIV